MSCMGVCLVKPGWGVGGGGGGTNSKDRISSPEEAMFHDNGSVQPLIQRLRYLETECMPWPQPVIS